MLALIKSGQKVWSSELFDDRFYLKQQSLTQRGSLYALAHYLLIGTTRGVHPNPLFNPRYYLGQNNIRMVGAISPLEHFIRQGSANGFKTSNLFDWLEFGQKHGLEESGIAIMRYVLKRGHFVRYGLPEIEEYQAGVTPRLLFPAALNPKVSILVVAENPQWTFHVLKSIHDALSGLSCEVTLINAACNDQALADFSCGVIPVEISGTTTASKTLAQAVATAQSDFLLVLAGYTVLCEGAIKVLVDLLETCPQVGMVGPRLVSPDGSICDGGRIVSTEGQIEAYGTSFDPEASEVNYLKAVDGLSPACLLVRKELWGKVAGLDGAYVTPDYAWTDFAFRLRALQHEIIYQPKAVAVDLRTTRDISFSERDQKRFLGLWQPQLIQEHAKDCGSRFTARDRRQNMPTILLIDSHVPHFDKDAGSRHTFQYLKWFVELGFNVKFLGDNYFPHQPYTEVLQQLGIEVLYGPWIAEHWTEWLNQNAGFLDYVYLHRPEVARKYLRVLTTLNGPKVLYFGHDLHGMRLRRQYEVERREALLTEAQEQEQIEYEVFRMVDAVYYPSFVEIDEILRREPALNARAIPLYLVDEIPIRAHRLAQRRDLLFVGGFRHSPNVDAMLWFVEWVLPLIQAQLKDVNLNIVGSNMPQSIRDLKHPNVHIVGEVTEEELHVLYGRNRICVVPLRYGAGIKGKVIEALELQIPVVTTNVGAEGLSCAEDYMIVADDADLFARGVVELYTDDTRWQTIVQRGREALLADFSKDQAYRIMQQDIDFPRDCRALRTKLSNVQPVHGTPDSLLI